MKQLVPARDKCKPPIGLCEMGLNKNKEEDGTGEKLAENIPWES